jgi:hypothetical protein
MADKMKNIPYKLGKLDIDDMDGDWSPRSTDHMYSKEFLDWEKEFKANIKKQMEQIRKEGGAK